MIGGSPFPIGPGDLTPDFIGAALDCDVVSLSLVEIGRDRGMLGDLVLVEPRYGSRRGPERIVAKFAADRAGSLASAQRSGSHLRELRFYDELASTTPARTPAFYGAWYDADTARFLMLQEAIDADTSVDQVIGIDLADARLVVREMARLHARWWRSSDLEAADWLPRLDSPARRSNLAVIATHGLQPLQHLVADDVASGLWGEVGDLPARIDDVLCRLAQLPHTLIHSDLRADNLLFDRVRDEAVLIDWQGAGVGPPSWDLAYFMSQSLAVDVRRRHESELLDSYCEVLACEGLDLARAEILDGYGASMLFGLVVACSLPLVADTSQPRVRSLAVAMAQRALEGLRDHR